MFFETFSQALTAGQTAHFPGGKRFVLMQASDPVDMTFIDGMGHTAGSAKQVKGGFRGMCENEEGKAVSLSRIEVTSASAQTVVICISNGEAVYDRSQGDVNVIGGTIDTVSNVLAIQELLKLSRDDSDYYYTNADKAAIGGTFCPATASNYSHIQLFNPSANMHNVIVRSLTIRCKAVAATVVSLRSNSAGLSGTLNCWAGSKKIGISFTPGGYCRNEANASLLGGRLAPLPVHESIILPVTYSFKDSLILNPGSGLIVVNEVVNSYLEGVFEWIEP